MNAMNPRYPWLDHALARDLVSVQGLVPEPEPFGGDQFQIAVRTALLGALLGAFSSIASGSEGRGILKGAFIGFGVGGLAGFTIEPIVEKHVQQKLRNAIQDSPLFGALGRASS